ncbi:MAG: FAD-binding protein [Candidatus Nitrosocosmicus sp.]|nr:FAD-binding protein [Candidatus Nitrosocosmicus sp.]
MIVRLIIYDDVIVIGGGSAGLELRIEAHDNGSIVLLISKSGVR